MEGYYGNAEESARVLSPDGWLDTGDLGYLTDGQIIITGRAKDLIIINGRNIWPQDLEWAAESEVAALRSGDVAVFSADRSEEHTSELQSLMRISYAVFCLKKKNTPQ